MLSPCFSVKTKGIFNALATSCPMMSPPMAGERIISMGAIFFTREASFCPMTCAVSG